MPETAGLKTNIELEISDHQKRDVVLIVQLAQLCQEKYQNIRIRITKKWASTKKGNKIVYKKS